MNMMFYMTLVSYQEKSLFCLHSNYCRCLCWFKAQQCLGQRYGLKTLSTTRKSPFLTKFWSPASSASSGIRTHDPQTQGRLLLPLGCTPSTLYSSDLIAKERTNYNLFYHIIVLRPFPQPESPLSSLSFGLRLQVQAPGFELTTPKLKAACSYR